MSDITVTINGRECKAKEGEYILNIARREGIFIPAICYLTGCSPTLACRICLVETNGKRSYSCNTKAKDGMEVITDNEEIAKERRAIMQVYNVNHPLQCGVCDQSGECELQNYTLYTSLNKQEYAIQDMDRSAKEWGVMKYDPGLCIVCEKCVTVCKDMIGSSALSTVKRGGEPINKELKSTMPKDAYAMWNKLQKSLIGYDENSCIDCGECIAVCPVGALISKDFQYTSNAWELKRIPAANPHSSDCSLMYYEVKAGANSPQKRIYRVTNDAHYVSLNGAARFGYDFENRVTGKDKANFEKVVNFIKESADTIKFSSFITNEEAYILQKIKEKYNLKLINEDARRYKIFMDEYSKITGKSLYSGNLKTIKASNFVISVGSAIRYDSPNSGFAFNNAMTMNKGAGLYFHPILDKSINGYAKTMVQINYTPGVEESVLYFILDLFGDKENMPSSLKDNIDSEKLRETIGIDEDFDASLTKLLNKKDSFSLIVGEDLYTHPNAKNLAKLVGAIDKYTDFSVLIIPSQTNTLGVSLICDLDEKSGESVLGYNENGDCILSALGDGDLDIPALNQQEGTFTNIDKRVVPTNAALEYYGYCLNDIANELGLEKKYTIDYTSELPQEKGFSPLEFDLLPNFFDNGANEIRGYLLESKDCDVAEEYEEIKDVDKFDGDIVYRSNPINQFNYFTNKAHQLQSEGKLYVSEDFLNEKSLSDGDEVEISNDHDTIRVKIELDKQIGKNISYLPTFDKNLNIEKLFNDGYRFTKVSIKGVS